MDHPLKDISKTLRHSKFAPRSKSALKKQLALLTIPIFIETLLIMSLGAMDTFMLSRHSDASVAAVGLANQVISFTFIIFEVINLGTSVLCSQYLGAGMRDRMITVTGMSLVVNLLFGVVVSLALFFFATPIMSALGLEGELLPIGAEYMRIVGIAAFVQALSMTLSAVLRSNDKAYYPMLVVLVVNILNICGNYILIFGKFGAPALGANGAAITTAVARTVAMVILFIIVFRTTVPSFPWHIFRKWPGHEFRNLMKIGLPAAGEQMSYSCSQLVIAFFITGLGMEALATRTYCANVIMYVYLFCIAISHGGAIVIGHLVGAARWNGAFVMGKYVMKIATLLTLSFSIILALLGKDIMSALTHNPEIIALGVTIFWIDVVLEIGRPINIFAVNALQAAGDVNFPFYVGVIVMWLVAVLAGWYFGVIAGFGILGMWWMFALDENIRGVIFLWRWFSKKWMFKGFTPASK